MRYLPLFLLTAALASLAFAYWGLETPGGRRAYDEMAGIIPMAAGFAGAVFFVAALGLWLWRRFGTRSDTGGTPRL